MIGKRRNPRKALRSAVGAGLLLFAALIWGGVRRATDAVDYAQLAFGLGFVSRNYATAVGPTGGVFEPAEFPEEASLLRDAAAAGTQLPFWDHAAAERIETATTAGLKAAAPTEVLPAVDAALRLLALDHDLGRAPPASPSWQRGQALFKESCEACHGSNGSGREAPVLSMRPPDLSDPVATGKLSPASVFGAVTYGVPESPMPSFAAAYSDPDRWNLAFYTLALSRPRQISPAYAYPALKNYVLKDLAASSDFELTTELGRRGVGGWVARAQLDYLRSVAPFTDR